ncbi:MAG: PHB depolymerase family esterase, partial [Caldimonas sp.]
TALSATTVFWGGAGTETLAKENTTRSAGTPVIVFHGDADATVAPANGDAVVAATLGADPGVERSESHAAPAAGARGFHRTVWRDADAGPKAPSLAEQWLVRGTAHAWSGGAAAGSYTDPSGPDASREMLRFFLEHPRRPGASSAD